MKKLKSLEQFGIKPGLERIKALLKLMGDPQRGLKVIHVAGTNGKGSVCAMLESILRQAGFRTGLFTSPHLVDLRERFQVDGRPITRGEFAALFTRLWPALRKMSLAGTPATYFEATTALGLMFFAKRKAELVVLETGLGGRYDSTNVFDAPLVTVVTNISLDHTRLLGKTVESIAWEKAGIAKPGVSLVTGASPAAVKVIRQEWKKLQPRKTAAQFTSLRLGSNWSCVAEAPADSRGQTLRFKLDSTQRRLTLPLLGAHQHENLACAVAVCKALAGSGLKISEASIRKGLASTRWPGRMQVISRRPLVLLDGAHNPAGAEALSRTLVELSHGRTALVIGVLKDKDWKGILRPFVGNVDRYFVSSPKDKRALPARELQSYLRLAGCQTSAYPSLAKALGSARRWAAPADTVAVAGSLYTVGELLKKC